ncbi:MAG: hypothetical protein OQJ76_05235 [Rhodospirillales bacterium]|nr:hypothetical protein [Rhodospirillales bacterium]MCW8951715.1 hypothetical protein [Rhodospirillales bacterium]MCW9039881.1 hypothetical protein [Rhodospirillales bacterium]
MQHVKIVLLAAFVTLGVLAAAPAGAEERPASQALSECAAGYDSCVALCAKAHSDSEARNMGCGAGCAAERAACEAKAGYDQAKPWVDKTMEGVKKFLDDLMKDQGGQGDDATPDVDKPKEI